LKTLATSRNPKSKIQNLKSEIQTMGLFRSTLSAIRKGMARTREVLTTDIGVLLRGQMLTEKIIDELERRLITADVGVKAVTSIIGDLRESFRTGKVSGGDDAFSFLKARLKQRWSEGESALAVAATKPTVILVVGVNGSGKTTSVAKIARSLRDEGRSVLLAAADTFRAGAVAQLEIWAQRLGVEIVKGRAGADPASVVFDAADAAMARGVDVLLIDTAGRLHTQEHLMRQLTKIRDVVAKKFPGAPHEVLLVLDATSGQNAIVQAEIFKKATNVTGIFLAKLDGTAKGGIVIAIRDALNVPVKLVGVGERPEDVEPFDPDAFIEAMFAE
jgi:fused signal recognition particle receptor